MGLLSKKVSLVLIPTEALYHKSLWYFTCVCVCVYMCVCAYASACTYIRESLPVCNFSNSYLSECLTLDVTIGNKKDCVIAL